MLLTTMCVNALISKRTESVDVLIKFSDALCVWASATRYCKMGTRKPARTNAIHIMPDHLDHAVAFLGPDLIHEGTTRWSRLSFGRAASAQGFNRSLTCVHRAANHPHLILTHVSCVNTACKMA